MAATILGSRMVSPIMGLAGLLNRWQQTKVALRGIDKLMELPLDVEVGRRLVHSAHLKGNYEIRDAQLFHRAEATRPSLTVQELKIQAGEKIAVLGRNGAGKSSLLQLLSGLVVAREGEVTLEGVSLAHLDPADVRRDVSLLSQQLELGAYAGGRHPPQERAANCGPGNRGA